MEKKKACQRKAEKSGASRLGQAVQSVVIENEDDESEKEDESQK